MSFFGEASRGSDTDMMIFAESLWDQEKETTLAYLTSLDEKKLSPKKRDQFIKYIRNTLTEKEKSDLIFNAVSNDNTVLFTILEKAGAPITGELLIEACKRDNIAFVQYLLKIKEFSIEDRSLSLVEACEHNNITILKLLRSVSEEFVQSALNTSLILSSTNGYSDIVDILLRYNFDRETINTSFKLAALNGHTRIVISLDEFVLAEDEDELYFESIFPYRYGSEIVSFFLPRLSRIHRAAYLRKEMDRVIQENDIKTLKELLKAGADPNYEYIKVSFRTRNLEAIRAYLEAGVAWTTISRYARDHKTDFLRIIDEMRDDGYVFTPSQEVFIEDLIIEG